jgi:ectoine hydroxylase-related dioxygenase (phytanoyl-CoA dioxygenase family)
MAAGLTAEQRYFFDVNGYLLIEQVLSEDEISRLSAAIDAQRLPIPGDSIATQRFEEDFLLWDGAFRDLMNHPAVVPLLRDLLGDQLRLDHAYGIVMAPNTSGLGLHGGGTPWDPSQYYVYRGGRMYSGLTTVTWSLVDTPPNEGFGCIPASHKANECLPSDVPIGWVKNIPQTAGSVLIFTEALTHCTLPWKAPYDRRALLFKYSPGHLAWGRYRVPSKSLWRLLTGEQRRLLQPPSVYPHEPL